jgi:DNA-binding Lrp family transcriptional regulator
MGERRNQHGRFTPEHTDTDILAAVRAHEPAATSEVAAEVGMTRQGVDRRLRRLRDTGRVNSKKIGASLVWFVRDHADADDSSAEDVQDAGVTPDTGTEAVPPDRTREAESADVKPESDVVDATDAAEDALNALDTSEARRAAVRGCIDYLREHGTGQKSDFVGAVYPDHPGGYQSEGGWWNTIGKEYLKAVAEDLDALTPPPAEGSHTWEWRAEEGDDLTEQTS